MSLSPWGEHYQLTPTYSHLSIWTQPSPKRQYTDLLGEHHWICFYVRACVPLSSLSPLTDLALQRPIFTLMFRDQSWEVCYPCRPPSAASDWLATMEAIGSQKVEFYEVISRVRVTQETSKRWSALILISEQLWRFSPRRRGVQKVFGIPSAEQSSCIKGRQIFPTHPVSMDSKTSFSLGGA